MRILTFTDIMDPYDQFLMNINENLTFDKEKYEFN